MKLLKNAAVSAAAVLCFTLLPFQAQTAKADYYTAVSPYSAENGVLTLDNGEKWYKVNELEDGNDYIITVKGSDGKQEILTACNDSVSEYVWHYYRRTMVTSTAPEYTTLSSRSFYLVSHENELYTVSNWWADGENAWVYCDGSLCFRENGSTAYLRYSEGSDVPFSCTNDPTEAAEVSLYSQSEYLSRCIAEHPSADSYVIEDSGYAAPVFSAELISDDLTVDSIRWFVDGREQSCTELSFRADSLTEKKAGVHRVNCIIEAHDAQDIHYREKSADAAFIIAKGVMQDSFITFSDVHEQYFFITDAIEKVMEHTGGYIPALVICTGDLVNGPTASKDIMLERYYPRIISYLGGIDAVFVSGNHDSGEAASIMSDKAGLGAENDRSPYGGQIFRGTSDAAAMNGKSSRFAKGITVYGLNFEASLEKSGNDITYSYDRTIDKLDSFLKKTAEDYHGELVVISAHSGLHTLGVQPESVTPSRGAITKWIGENQYNIDNSFKLAKLINSYAEKYNMDIMYLFGHDHSRQESELMMTDGDELMSTVKYINRSYDSQPLKFTYAHSGYLSTTIGCADAHFSFVYRNGENYSFDLLSTYSDKLRHTDIKAKNIFKEPVVTTASDVTSAAKTTVTTKTTAKAASGKKGSGSPSTGDGFDILYIAAPAAALMLISRKRKKNDN